MVAFILDRTFDDRQLNTALDCLRRAGHEVVTVGAQRGLELEGRHGMRLMVERDVDESDPNAFDAAVVPGGIPVNHLRTHERLLNFLRDVYAVGKPVGVMRDVGFVLTRAETDVGRILTWPAVKRALLVDSIATIEDDLLRRDELILSEDGDITTFCDALVEELGRGHLGAAPRQLHEHVDVLDEEVVDSASGPAPTSL
ncbi:MAG: DJ-1/PfpI family protein [Myxococcaceae bacterium]|nr:DJ-1/PfpI family protein [Myxococcaceae bacterium]